MSENKTSFLVKGIDRKVWKKFKGTAFMNGYDSVGECLLHIIEQVAAGSIWSQKGNE